MKNSISIHGTRRNFLKRACSATLAPLLIGCTTHNELALSPHAPVPTARLIKAHAFPRQTTLRAQTVNILPDGASASVPGKGFSCTGLLSNSAGGYWVGNVGRVKEGDGKQKRPTIVSLSGDLKRLINEVEVSEQPQGLAYDKATRRLFYANPTSGNVWRLSQAAGKNQLAFQVRGANGLSFDTNRGALWVGEGSSGSNVYLYDLKNGRSLITIDVGARTDHLFYDAPRDMVWISTGTNGSIGRVLAVQIETGQVIYDFLLPEAEELEGISISGSQLTVANNAYYHSSSNRPNTILTYSLPLG
jgi:DNA-binding beta-propeller fold protein YncE